ncbi:MAG TPA: hypothetical protein VFL78_00340 [Rhodanobacteraceae bacterium]|nr:hypothetical protein [Rhodanobacteraceae bacterium]
MSMMSMRLNGSNEAIDTMLDVLRGSPGVDSVVEMGVADVPRMPEDSSSADLPSDMRASAHDVEVHAVDDAASDNVRNRTEIAARDAGVLVEWLEPF